MAEIPVEKKSSKAWLWILLALILLALLIWWATDNDDDEVANEVVGEQTIGADPVTPPEPVAMESGVTIADILGNPTEYVGRNDFQSEVSVGEVPTDRGFWVEDQGQRLFALIIDQPLEVPMDINSGQQLRITEGMVRDATFLSELPGVEIDADTRRIIEGQDAYLVVNEENVEILSATSN